jgi:Tfp pilus assembly protein PilF
MDKKKITTPSHSTSGVKYKQIPTSTKGTSVPKQTSRAASSSGANNTAVVVTHPVEYMSNIQNHILFWLDSNITQEDDESRRTATQLQSIINTIHLFNDADECAKFLNTLKSEKVFMVVSGRLGQQIVPRIHSLNQLVAVFVFCGNKSDHELWASRWIKVKGIFTDINELCESMKQVGRQYDEDSIDFSVVPARNIAGQKLDKLDQSFMYTQLIKEILLELEYNDQSIQELVTYCRKKYASNHKELKKIDKFENDYRLESPIWWYTLESFLYHMVNRALRGQEIDVILKMGFFIRDVHLHIAEVHKKQSKNLQKKFTVYRGQGMLGELFENIQKSKGGLISFNNFLSTSREPEVATLFATSALANPSYVGVLFIINIDPSVPSAPFASLDEISCYKTMEKEILFSTHTVFRIGDIQQSKNGDGIWNIHLTLTRDNDPQLNALLERMRVEIKGSSPLYRLGALMIKLGEFKKAEEVFENLFKRTTDELEKGHIFFQLGQINDNLHDYNKALRFYQDALTIYKNKLNLDHPNIATCYNNIGLVYDNANDHDKALPYYEEALEIYRKTLPDNHPNIATASNSIGMIYNTMGDYSKALSCCKKALDIFEKELSAIHPLVATSYNNIGLIYANMKKYTEASTSYKRAVEIGEQILPPNHPTLQIYKENLNSVRKKVNK